MEKKNLENLRQNANQWLDAELNKLRPSHYDGTFFTIVHLRNEAIGAGRNIVVPVDKYVNDDIGFEAIRINALAAQCPWDMTETLIDVDTGITVIKGQNLYDMVEDSVVNARLSELNKERTKDIGVYNHDYS